MILGFNALYLLFYTFLIFLFIFAKFNNYFLEFLYLLFILFHYNGHFLNFELFFSNYVIKILIYILNLSLKRLHLIIFDL